MNIITGGKNGIGRALVAEFGGLSLDIEDGCDVTSAADLDAALASVNSCELLILNAGIMVRGDLVETSEVDFDKIFSVNVKGAWLTYKKVKPLLNGPVVIISSIHALTPCRSPGVYAMTKRAMAWMGEAIGAKIAYIGPTVTRMNDDTPRKRDEPSFVASKIRELVESEFNSLVWTEDGYIFK